MRFPGDPLQHGKGCPPGAVLAHLGGRGEQAVEFSMFGEKTCAFGRARQCARRGAFGGRPAVDIAAPRFRQLHEPFERHPYLLVSCCFSTSCFSAIRARASSDSKALSLSSIALAASLPLMFSM